MRLNYNNMPQAIERTVWILREGLVYIAVNHVGTVLATNKIKGNLIAHAKAQIRAREWDFNCIADDVPNRVRRGPNKEDRYPLWR